MGGGVSLIGDYFINMLDLLMNWKDVEDMVKFWDGQFCFKGIMSVDDVKCVVDIGCIGIVIFNYGGCQLDGL